MTEEATPETALLQRARTTLLWDGVFARIMDVLTGGMILAGLALHMGAGSFLVGVLASLPFFAQVAQFPTVKILAHVHNRKAVTLTFVTLARASLFVVAGALLWRPAWFGANALVLTLGFMATMGVIATGAWNWWVRDTIPRGQLGQYFGRRLRFTSAFSAFALLGAGILLDHYIAQGIPDAGYALLFALGGIAGLWSNAFLFLTPHKPPAHEPRTPHGPMRAILRTITDERNRRLSIALSLVAVTMTTALPFTAVFLLRGVGYPFVVVATLSFVNLLAYLGSLRAWGHLSDRYGNQPVMQISLGILVLSLIGWGVAWGPNAAPLFALLVAVHFLTGFALGGLELTAQNILLKTAPTQGAPAYLAGLSLMRALAAGVATVLAGAAWQALGYQTLLMLEPFPGAHWSLRGFHLLALASALIGLLALAALPRIHEEGRVPVHDVALAMRRETRTLSSVAGMRAFVHVVSYVVEYLADTRPRRERNPRAPKPVPAPDERDST